MSQETYAEALYSKVLHSPYPAVIVLFLAVCIYTRISSGLTSMAQQAGSSKAQPVRVVPYWIPYIGHAISMGARFKYFLDEVR